jgi:hypothetical protein
VIEVAGEIGKSPLFFPVQFCVKPSNLKIRSQSLVEFVSYHQMFLDFPLMASEPNQVNELLDIGSKKVSPPIIFDSNSARKRVS